MWKKRASAKGTKLPAVVYSVAGKPGQPMTRLNSFMPRKKTCVMHYADQYTIGTLAAGSYSAQSMRGNGVYDPDLTGTGHQPRGFDQMAALYGYYAVKSSTCRVRFCPSSAGQNVLVGLQADSTAGTSPSLANVIDFLEGYPYNVASSNTDGSVSVVTLQDKRFTKSMSTEPVTGQGNLTANNTNPADPWLWRICVYNAGSVSATGLYYVDVWFEVEWSEPLEQGAS